MVKLIMDVGSQKRTCTWVPCALHTLQCVQRVGTERARSFHRRALDGALQGYALPLFARMNRAVSQTHPSATATVKAMLITGLPAPEAIPANATR
jgi:hypothetical protein